MLNRQKVLLELLRRAERPVSKIEFVKWCFLMRHETRSGGGPTFYEFLPYLYGPYSFGLHRELTDLANTGYVREDSDNWVRPELSIREVRLPKAVEADTCQIIRRYGSAAEDELLDHVYERFPQYTMNSRRRQLVQRPIAEPMVYTVGYEGRQVDGFLWILVSSGIRRLIDVRNNPIARRYGFHKSTLTRLCPLLDIEYVHVPELGIPSVERREVSSDAARDRLLTKYTDVTISTQEYAVRRVAEWVTERASALMCMEAKPCECHRSHLATAIAQHTGLSIRHLGVSDGYGSTG
jgi:uncharacterized protein (DUF488 family)